MSLVSNDVNRRRLLGLLGIAGAGAAATALAPTFEQELSAVAYAPTDHVHDSSSDEGTSNQDDMTWEQMDEHHKAGILSFPAETAGKGDRGVDRRGRARAVVGAAAQPCSRTQRLDRLRVVGARLEIGRASCRERVLVTV